MRVLKKIAVFPVIVILLIAKLAMYIILEVESHVIGIGFLFLGICAVLALFNQMWLQLGIFCGLFAILFLLLFISAGLQVWVESLVDRLKSI